jgi:O-antigen/teichoic acid export membrane protein
VTAEGGVPAAGGLRRETLISATGSLGAAGVAGLASIIITRRLGVSARGEWAAVSSLAVLVGAGCTLGLPTAAAYAAARTAGAQRLRVIGSMITVCLPLSMIAALVYLALSPVVRPHGLELTVMLPGALIAVLAVWLHLTVQLTLTTTRLEWFAAGQIVPASAMLIAITGLVLLGRLTVANVIFASAASSLLGVLTCLAGLAGNGLLRWDSIEWPRQALTMVRPYLAYAALTFGTTTLTQVTQRVDVLLVLGLRGVRDAGLYAVASQFGDLLLILPAALGYVMFRRGSTSTAEHWEDALRSMRWTAIAGVAMALVIEVIASDLMQFLFGERYQPSVAAVRLLLPGIVLLSVQSVISAYVASRGRPRVVLFAWLSGATFGMVADLIVIPIEGIRGAAVVSTLSYGLVLGLHISAVRALKPVSA